MMMMMMMIDDDDNDDSLLHIFALKMNYNMFTLAIRNNIKIYTFSNQFWVWAYKYVVKNYNYYNY